MEIGEKVKMTRQDWLLASPWLWTFLGLGFCLLAWGMVLALGNALTAIRVAFIFLGLLAAAAGVAIRLNSSAPSHLDRMGPRGRKLVLLGLGILFAFIAVTATVLPVLRLFDVNPVQWRLSGLIILWVIVGPMSLAATVYCARRSRRDSTITPAEEGAAVLALAAFTTFCACWALYNPHSGETAWALYSPRPWEDWASMRLFLGVVFLVTLVAAPLLLVPQSIRRLVVSLLIVLHFGGIGMAALSAPPAPWIVQQIWGRVYQPYLEFMYLNNAYHFYAPEPGPASFLWFRLYCENPQGEPYAYWVKIPDLDDDGWHKNTVALEYQRMLAATENVVPSDPTPSTTFIGLDGKTYYADWYARRLEHSSDQTANIGQPKLDKDELIIPFHPTIQPVTLQYLQPNESSRVLLSSYARHVCQQPHPEHKDWKITNVRIYRVVHWIPEVGTFVGPPWGVIGPMDPRDPSNYKPYYMGKYDPDGRLLDIGQFDAEGNLVKAGDPFLFWLLPMVRDDPRDLKSPIKSWVAKHAGDPDWIYTFDEKKKRHLLAPAKQMSKLEISRP